MKLLVVAGAKINWCSSEGDYALAVARREGHWEIVAYLRGQGAIDYEERQQALDSGLIVAATSGDVAQVKSLLDQGANVHTTDDQGRTALITAASRGHVDIVEALLGAGAEVDASVRATGETAVLVAAKNGHPGIIKMLAKAGADLNRRTHDTGHTPMVLAAVQGHLGLVQFLIKAGAIVDPEALFASIRRGDVEMVGFLAGVGMDLNMEGNTHGATPLLYAIETGTFEVVEILLLAGASPNRQSTRGVTPLAKAANQGDAEVVALLLSAGAEARFDRDALVQASGTGHVQIVQQLLHAGAGAETMALIRAAEVGHIEVVRALLKAGADPYARTKQRHTALGRATARGHRHVAEILAQWAGGNHTKDRRAVHTSKAGRRRVGRGSRLARA